MVPSLAISRSVGFSSGLLRLTLIPFFHPRKALEFLPRHVEDGVGRSLTGQWCFRKELCRILMVGGLGCLLVALFIAGLLRLCTTLTNRDPEFLDPVVCIVPDRMDGLAGCITLRSFQFKVFQCMYSKNLVTYIHIVGKICLTCVSGSSKQRVLAPRIFDLIVQIWKLQSRWWDLKVAESSILHQLLYTCSSKT